MKISVWKEFEGYMKNPHHEVYLDGEKEDLVVVADEEKGFVIKYRKNKKGEFMFRKGINRPKVEVVLGDVEIKPLINKNKN